MNDFFEWLSQLEPGFAFLLALPFAVAVLGVLAHRRSRQREGAAQRADAPPLRHRDPDAHLSHYH